MTSRSSIQSRSIWQNAIYLSRKALRSDIHFTVLWLLFVVVLQLPAHAQVAINCDNGCGESPSTTTSGLNVARTAATAARGMGTATQPAASIANTTALEGSQSYTYEVALFAVPGRTGRNVNLNLYYNSMIWTNDGFSMVLNADRDTPSYGFRLGYGFIEISSDSGTGVLTEPNGLKHPVKVGTAGGSYVTSDGTYIQIQPSASANSAVASYKDGTRVTYEAMASPTSLLFRPVCIQDTNGNFISVSYLNTTNLLISSITDTVGRILRFSYDPSGTLLQSISQMSAAGVALHTFTFSWNQQYVLNFAFVNATPGLTSGTTILNVLTGVIRPDGTSVKFIYGDWGIVKEIQELSKSGNVRYSTSYNFPAAPPPPPCHVAQGCGGSGGGGTSPDALLANPAFTSQVIFDGVNQGTWTFAVTRQAPSDKFPAGLVTNFVRTDPLGTIHSSTFSSAGDGADGLPIQEQESFTPNCSSSPCPDPVVLRTTNRTLVLDNLGVNPRSSTLTTILEDGTTQSQVNFKTYDANGNVTDLQEYDFGQGAPGALLRETLTTFAAPGNGIVNKPARITVQDGNQKVFSKTDLNYDEGTVTNFVQNPVGHDATFTSAVTARGNLTSVIQYTDAAGAKSGVTSRFTYDAAGNVLTSKRGSGPQTQNNFSATTQFAYPDAMAVGPQGSQLSTAYTYNEDGRILTMTDANGQKTTFTYDSLGRRSTTRTADQVTLTTTYDDDSTNPSRSVSSTANSLVLKATKDGFGHVLSKQILNGGTVVSTTSQINDILGRVSQVSNPFGPSETPAYTTYSYDNIGRTAQVTPPAVGNSAQNAYQNAYSGTAVTVTDPAGQQKKKYFDALGHLVRVDEPGSLGGAAASGSVTISGSVKSVPSNSASNGATAGTASITISPTAACSAAIIDRCNTQVVQQAAASARITVTISGADATNRNCVTNLRTGHATCSAPQPDTGTATLAANIAGTAINSGQVSYDGTAATTNLSLAQHLSSVFTSSPVATLVNAATSNADGSASFTVATAALGNATNSSTMSVSFATSCEDTDFTVCGGPGWRVSLSGPGLAATTPSTTASANFSGGLDLILTTKYDSGLITVSFTANGMLVSEQIPYGQTDTAATLAQALLTMFSQDVNATAVVNAGCTNGTCSDGVVNLTTVATGSGTNYPLTLSTTTNSAYFPPGSTSFTVSSPNTSFIPGQPGTLYDSGTIKAQLTGFSSENSPVETVTFGQGSTAAGIAASLVGKINSDPQWQTVTAILPPGSSTIAFAARAAGTDANSYSITISEQSSQSASFPTPSFPNASVQLSGGSASTPSFDPTAVLTATYSYDPQGHLLQVKQGQQTRTYTYDGLGRMLSTTVPESGYNAVNYTYADFGAVSTITIPRMPTAITKTYTYDSLGRAIDVKYSDSTPEMTFSYGAAGAANNGGGRLIGTSDGTGSRTYAYDVMGRLKSESQNTGGATYTTGYAYNGAGDLLSITYPSGRVITQKYDDIGRFTEVDNNAVPVYDVNSYNAGGQVLGMTYGNGVTGFYAYNAQSQVTEIQYATAAGPLMDLSYDYGGANDNGQIRSIVDNLAPTRSTSYAYDELGRVQIAQTTDLASANTWKLNFTYDRYGNRLSQTPVGGTSLMPMNEVLVDPATNHLSSAGQTYDQSGNMTSDGLHTYTYDAEGRITHVDGTANNFGYDASGFRVNRNGVIYIASAGKVIAEYPSGGSAAAPNVEYVYAGSQRVATVASGTTTYLYWDHLSVRSSADSNGATNRTFGHFPFGESWYETGTASDWKFTTYRRDAEAEGGLDYANARFNSTRIGRFMSLDPLFGNTNSPQSLNRYSYVANDPINSTDPDGRDTRDVHEILGYVINFLAGRADAAELARANGNMDSPQNAVGFPEGGFNVFDPDKRNGHFGTAPKEIRPAADGGGADEHKINDNGYPELGLPGPHTKGILYHILSNLLFHSVDKNLDLVMNGLIAQGIALGLPRDAPIWKNVREIVKYAFDNGYVFVGACLDPAGSCYKINWDPGVGLGHQVYIINSSLVGQMGSGTYIWWDSSGVHTEEVLDPAADAQNAEWNEFMSVACSYNPGYSLGENLVCAANLQP